MQFLDQVQPSLGDEGTALGALAKGFEGDTGRATLFMARHTLHAREI